MKKRYLFLIVFLIIGIFVFRKAILGFVTKNQEKDFFTIETTDFTIEFNYNLEKGCPQSGIFFMNDTLNVKNYDLINLLYFLTDKNLNCLNIIGHKQNSKKRYNFSYFPKDSAGNYKLHRAEILYLLGKELKFTYKYDTIETFIYLPHIVDENKLLKHQTSKKNERFSKGKNYIKHSGNSLDQFFQSFEILVDDFIIRSEIKDSSYYDFYIPTIKRDKIISFFHDELGIELTKEKSLLEIITIRFNE